LVGDGFWDVGPTAVLLFRKEAVVHNYNVLIEVAVENARE